MRELSVFVDESGDFGTYSNGNPVYLFTLVFHDQGNDVFHWIDALKRELCQIDDNMRFFHAGPLIRREESYRETDIVLRRRAFNKMSFAVKHLPILYSTVLVEKKHVDKDLGLAFALARPFGRILRDNLSFFQRFDLVKIYYDNGQKELSKLLATLFGAFINKIEFRTVNPKDYILFQVADYLSTLELVHHKFETKMASKSEIYFFGSAGSFYRNYYRQVLSKKF